MNSSRCLSEFAFHFAEYFKSNKNSQSLSVSTVEGDDLPEIVSFYDEAFKNNRWFGTQMGSKSLWVFFSDALMTPEILWLKLTSGDETVGFSALIEDGDFLYSDETLISTACQGRGIGTIYFRGLCNVARQQEKPIYGDIIYSKHSRVIARVFAAEFGLVPIGFVLSPTSRQSPLVMVRIATQKSLQNFNKYEQVRVISDAIYKKNAELKGSSKKCVGFNHDTNTPMLLDDQESVSYLLRQNDQTEVRPVACLLELIKLQIPLARASRVE
jgi:predicted GNAT superfamily acetyltransferase